jgi:predicted metal-binding membrane protein
VVGDRRRLAGFAAGYIVAWAATAAPAFVLVNAGQAAVMRFGGGSVLAAAAFLLVALYQLSPLKELCLQKCRSPLSLLFQYSNYDGRLRDIRAGARHGVYCLGCCWALMLLLPMVGMLNLVALIVITAFVAVEKNFMRGMLFSRLAAAAAAILALSALFLPQFTSGLFMR